MGKLALDFLLPQYCIGCGREGGVLCPACAAAMPRIQPPFCQRCGLPLDGGSCPDCGRLEACFDGLRSPFRFERLARQAVHQLKYQNLRLMAEPLAAELALFLQHNPLPVDVIMPVPLHPRRLRERGYNQSALLAAKLAPVIGLKVDEHSLKRARHTISQARAESAAQRRQNMDGAFVCRAGVSGKRVLLIDDVATSGATINGCAIALKEAGALSVWGLTVAREV
jgi:ComF family protein